MSKLISIFVLVFFASNIFSQTTLPNTATFKDHEALIIFDDAANDVDIEDLISIVGMEILEGPTPNIGCYRLKFTDNALANMTTNPLDSINGVIKKLNEENTVDGVGLNFRDSSDSYLSSFTGLEEMEDCYKLFDGQETGPAPVLTAIADTGISKNPAILGNFYDPLSLGFNFLTSNPNLLYKPVDRNGHGTHLSSIITKDLDNDAEQILLKSYKTQNINGIGNVFDAIKALDRAMTEGVNVINMSFSYYIDPGEGFHEKEVFALAIQKAQSAGILVVASAGNNTNNNDSVEATTAGSIVVPQKGIVALPASFPNANIISVASADCNKEISYFSNYGQASVDVLAPGEDIWGYNHKGELVKASGTSQATAYVTKLATFLGTHKQGFDWEEVKCAIMEGVEESPSGELVLSGGYINVANSLEIYKLSNCLGVDSYIAPTPNNNDLNIIVDEETATMNINSQHDQICVVQFVDAMGRVLKKMEVNVYEGDNPIDFEVFPVQINGVYFITIQGEGINNSFKLFR